MKLKTENIVRLKWLLTIVLTTLGVFLSFKYLLPLILPFIISYFLAWIIRPTTEFLHRRLRIPRIIGGSISLIVVICAAGTGIFYLVNTLLRQIIAFIKNIPIYLDMLAERLDHVCHSCDRLLGLAAGTVREVVDENMLTTINRVKSNVMPNITQRTIAFTIFLIEAIGVLLIIFIAALLIAKDLPGFHERYQKNEIYNDVHKVTLKLADAGVAYLRTQIIIMVIVAFLSVLGLTILRNGYALLIGLTIAIMDALPILGSGLIYIPWSIIMLLNGNIYAAAILITTFLVCQIIREILEPKLIGNRIGIKPLFTLIAMYVGVKLFSIAGFILGPIGLIIIMTVVKVVGEKSVDNNVQDDPLRDPIDED